MANKLLVFLGLANEGEVVVESHRGRRQSEYIKKIQRLVVPEDDGTAQPETAAESEASAFVPAQAAEIPEITESAASAEDAGKGSFMNRMQRLVEPLRRPESESPLILVRKDIESMLNDIEEGLLEGRTLLVDFAGENERVARITVERLASFVKMKKGYFFPVTSTSLLISLRSDAVVEWLPEETGKADAEPQDE